MEQQVENIGIDETWYYVIVQNPGKEEEELVGFFDSDTNEKFIPSFKTKEEATKCFSLMPKDVFNGKYETQAMIGEDLLGAVKENGHKIYLLDKNGKILELLN